MGRDSKYDVLFEPLKIGPKVAKNRFYQTPHCSGLGVDLPGAQAHMRGMKAEGGWAIVNTEYCSIHPEMDDSPWIPARIWDENDVRNLSLMCDKVHEHGCLAGIELHYGGADHTGYDSRLPARGVCQDLSDPGSHSCYAMSKADIRELQGFYVAAARRAASAGFDVINVHGREVGSVTIHFLMNRWNRRTDEYGGSFENRARFWRETVEMVKEAVGDTCAIAVGMCIDSLHTGDEGIRPEVEGAQFIEHVDHLVDLWDLQAGGPTVHEWTEDAAPSRMRPEGWQEPFVSKVRRHTQKPIAGVGRFTNPDTMVRMINSGPLDMIGAARPSISDPFLPKKIEEGRLDDIRECIGCNMCAARFNLGGARIVCTQNATMGEEYRRGWHPERFSKAANAETDVLIVGAGPAGMECARVLGNRGMRRVHIVDAESDVGGIMRWIPQLPGLGEWGRVVNYRQIALDKLSNVTFVPRKRLEASDCIDYGAEIIICATGSRWATDGHDPATHAPIPGADAALPHVLTPEQIMLEGKDAPGDRLVVYDAEGYFMGMSIAEHLAKAGKQVTYVTPLDTPGLFMSYTGEGSFMNRKLRELGVEVLPSHAVTAIHPGSVEGEELYRPGTGVAWQADGVVLVTQRRSQDSLYHDLLASERLDEEGIVGVYRIGDCVQPRHIAEAIFDGHRLAREIDSPDPAVPLPYIREYRIIGLGDAALEQAAGKGQRSSVNA